MDKDALDVIADVRLRHYSSEYQSDRLTAVDFHSEANDYLAALLANGYVVVPRHLLDELTLQSSVAGRWMYSDGYDIGDLSAAVAAVVEAVGPTREDCLRCGQPLAAHGDGLGQIGAVGCARVAEHRQAVGPTT